MQQKNRGFSLIEVAIVLVIITVLVTIVAVPLATQVDQQRTNDTNKQLEQIKEAIYGFAMANGRLPCPARTIDNGNESFSDAANGVCNTFSGFLPAVTLGLSPVDGSGFAVDGWATDQNRIRYAVWSDIGTCNSISNPLTKPLATGLKLATVDCLMTPAEKPLLRICSSTPMGAVGAATGCAAGSELSTKAPFVLFSRAKNATVATPGLDESHNLDADMFFVAHAVTPTGAPGGEFDDLVTWGSLPILFSRLVSVGKLP